MARAQINPEEMLNRIILLQKRISDWSRFSDDSMKIQKEKTWSGVEIIQHMIIAQGAYTDKINSTINELKASNEVIESFPANRIPSFLIKRFPPQNGKIKFKMKTTKQFKPIFTSKELQNADVLELKNTLSASLEQLKGWIESAKRTQVESIRFASAIGPVVKFNVLEACEFILCHNERHFHQLEKSLAKVIG